MGMTTVVVVVGGVVVVDETVVVVVAGGVVVVVVVAGGVVVVVDPKVVVVVDAAEQVGTEMELSSSVTAPFLASARPDTEAPVLRVIDVKARMVPEKLLVVPRVALDPTCQNTLQAFAPFSNRTVLPDPVISVEPAWKMNTELGSPPPFRVTVPVRDMPAALW